jgi:hypothetical protein
VRVLVAAILLSFALTGCGSGYGGENAGIAGELPTVPGTKLVDKSFHSYCSQHTCVFRNDRSSVGFEFIADANTLTQQKVIDVYIAALDGWTPTIDRCANADPSFCDGLMSVRFTRGDAVISLSFLNWPSGRFGVAVDARGG